MVSINNHMSTNRIFDIKSLMKVLVMAGTTITEHGKLMATVVISCFFFFFKS